MMWPTLGVSEKSATSSSTFESHSREEFDEEGKSHDLSTNHIKCYSYLLSKYPEVSSIFDAIIPVPGLKYL